MGHWHGEGCTGGEQSERFPAGVGVRLTLISDTELMERSLWMRE